MLNSVSISSKKLILVVTIIGLLWALLVNTHNASYVAETKATHFDNGMIRTADDASYLIPPENFIKKGVWKDNSEGVSAYIQRPPGMGMIHWVLYQISSSQNFRLHQLFNLSLHAFSLYVFGLMAVQILGKQKGLVVQVIYSTLPCFWGYLFYYLTESITPSILVFLFYAYLKYHSKPATKWIIYQGILVGCLLLIRPQLGIFTLPFFYFMHQYLKSDAQRKWMYLILSVSIAFGGMLIWQVRSATIANRFAGLHPIYDVTNNTQYRPVHHSLGELYKVWEYNSEKFHSHLGLIWTHSVKDSNQLAFSINNAVLAFPKKVFKYVEPSELKDLFKEYYVVAKEIEPFEQRQLPVPGESLRERSLRLRIDGLTKMLRVKMWKEYYILTPLRSIEFMFSKSQLNQAIFQHKYRGKWWMECLRYACLFLILVSTAIVLFQLLNKRQILLFLFSWGLMFYFVYLFFIQKMNEERYLMPLLPLIFLMGSSAFSGWLKKRRGLK